MKRVNILIIEDNLEESTILKNYLEENGFNVVARAYKLREALSLIESISFDIAIIDIYLENHPDGYVIAEKINEKYKGKKPFLFLTGATGRKEFIKAKILAPHGYLLKPFNELELIYFLELIIDKHNFLNDKPTFTKNKKCFPLFIKKHTVFYKVQEDDVLYIAAEGRYIKIITAEESFIVNKALSDFFNFLPKKNFIRTHRKFIVNKNAIKEVHLNENLILLEGDKHVQIGRVYKSDFINHYHLIT